MGDGISVYLECPVCGQSGSYDNLSMPQLELLNEQWASNHTHTKKMIEAYYCYRLKETIESEKFWGGGDYGDTESGQ